MLVLLSRVRLFTTPWTVAFQAPLSMEFSRQEYWSGLPFPPPGDLPYPGVKLGLLHCRQILYHLSHQGSIYYTFSQIIKFKRLSSAIISLPITPSSYKMTILSIVSFSHINALANVNKGFLRWHSGKESVCQYRRPRRLKFDPWIGRSPRGGTDNPLRCSCLENSMDRGAWRATVHKVMKSQAQLRCD